MNGVTKEERINMVSLANALCAPPIQPEAKDKYKMVRVESTTYPGTDVVKVLYPDNEDPTWLIVFKDGTTIHTTHPVTVVENAK